MTLRMVGLQWLPVGSYIRLLGWVSKEKNKISY